MVRERERERWSRQREREGQERDGDKGREGKREMGTDRLRGIGRGGGR